MQAERSSDQPLNYTFRQATAADYEFLYNLNVISLRKYVEATWGWEEAWQQEYFARKFDPDPRQIIQVAGEDVGVVVVEERDGDLYLALIELLPAYQGRGIGTQIIKKLMAQAVEEQRPLSLHVLKTNTPALRLYQRLGFEIVADEKIRYKMSCPN